VAEADVLLSAVLSGKAGRDLRPRIGAAALPVTAAAASSRSLKRARGSGRDPDDVGLLALALHFKSPIWSNDSDFEEGGIVWYTTASLLAALGPG